MNKKRVAWIALNLAVILLVFLAWILASAFFICVYDFIAGTDYFTWRFAFALGITMCLINATYRSVYKS